MWRARPALVLLLLVLTATASIGAPPATLHKVINKASSAPLPESLFESTYAVYGKTAEALRHQMSARGPHGYWAYTNWTVRWSRDCHVSLRISLRLPRLGNPASVPAALRARFDTMLRHLRRHEDGHMQNGRSAAAAIAAAHCVGANAIIQYWAEQDDIYDRQTDHGATQGAVLAE